jgi:uncharacterized CHY-type Zn-finger protein
MEPVPGEVYRALIRLRAEMLVYLAKDENELDFCGQCRLPFPQGDFEAYAFCPWCDLQMGGDSPRIDESRRIIRHSWERQDDIQCGECGGEYAQPGRYPFRFCPHCGAPFAPDDEMVIELPFQV